MNNSSEPLTTEQLFSRTKQRQQLLLKRQGTVLGVAVLFVVFLAFNVLGAFELSFLDAWLSRPQKVKTSHALLIPISEKSIQQIGAWPWPALQHAIIFELLERWGARSVYFEGSFLDSESAEERKPLIQVLEAKKIPIFFSAHDEKNFENAGHGLAVLNFDNPSPSSSVWVRPSAEIAKHAFLGHKKINPDSDRKFRFWQPWMEQASVAYPMVALKMLMELKIDFENESLIKLQETSLQLIPWNRKLFEKIERVEYADLMQSYLAIREGMQPTLSPDLFKGRDIFIGLTHETGSISGLSPWGQVVFPIEVAAMIYEGLSHSGKTLNRFVPNEMGWVLFMGVAGLLIVGAGFRVGIAFWIGWAVLLIGLILVWGVCLMFGAWLPTCLIFLFLLTTAGAIFIFDALHAKQERSALFHLATRDGLTGLYVIRHFRVIMNQMTREARARKEDIVVILMDIDHFKKINDTYGHPAGDMVLKKTADAIQSAVRQKRAMKDIDFVARYGGEEFIILVRRNSLENVAERIAERIRKTIQSAEYDWNGTKISVTVSLGVAILGETENIPDAMVHRADKALYLAKQRGRNQVCTEGELS